MKYMITPHRTRKWREMCNATQIHLCTPESTGLDRVLSTPGNEVLNLAGYSYLRNKDIRCTLYNTPDSVRVTGNKLRFYQVCTERGGLLPSAVGNYKVAPLTYTSDYEEAKEWATQENPVFARTLLSSHSGRGIEFIWPDKEPSIATKNARVFTKPLPAYKMEFRIHMQNFVPGRGQCVVYSQKKKRNGWRDNPEFSSHIQSWHTGWVYAFNNVNYHRELVEVALRACRMFDLELGVVDLAIVDGTIYLIEINTSPGMRATHCFTNYTELLGAWNNV
jgi:hypothetical protein